MIIKSLYTLKQIDHVFTNCIRNIWMCLAVLLCEPIDPSFSICHELMKKILMSLFIISWWISASSFCGYPSLATLLFFLASASSVSQFLFLKPPIRKCMSSGLSSAGYGNIIIQDIVHLDSIFHQLHFGTHVFLWVAAIHTFISVEPTFKFISYNHNRVILIELIAHILMGFLEPVYWFLVIHFVLELISHKK